jgi:hypothetical protein
MDLLLSEKKQMFPDTNLALKIKEVLNKGLQIKELLKPKVLCFKSIIKRYWKLRVKYLFFFDISLNLLKIKKRQPGGLSPDYLN